MYHLVNRNMFINYMYAVMTNDYFTVSSTEGLTATCAAAFELPNLASRKDFDLLDTANKAKLKTALFVHAKTYLHLQLYIIHCSYTLLSVTGMKVINRKWSFLAMIL